MAISAKMVKELREITGAGMMDCKKALETTDGDMDAAIDVLKKSGAAKAEKKASRIAAEGITRVAVAGNTAVVVEVNSETDFVAKNEVFQNFVQGVADKALNASVEAAGDGEDVVAILDMKADIDDITLKIGEKISVRRFQKVTGDCVVSYLHNGGKIGVLVAGNGACDEAAEAALKNVAMQVAAMSPEYIKKEDISAEELAKNAEITLEAALNDPWSLPRPILNGLIEKALNGVWSEADVAAYNEHKSGNFNYLPNFLSDESKAGLVSIAMADRDAIVENKIFKGLVDGRINKHLKEICLMDQVYVQAEDGKQSVAAYLKSVNPAITVDKMVRFVVGEGMQKREEDFAAEVAKQMGK